MRARTAKIAVAALWLAAVPAPSGAADPVLEACANPDRPVSETLTFCQRALRDPGLSEAQRAGVLTNLGVAQAALGRQGDAETSFSLAIATEPGLVAAHANRARSRLALGRFDEAMADFDRAVELAPRDPGVRVARGGALLRADRAEAAIRDFDAALALDAGNAGALFNRGIARLVLGRDGEAEADFSAVIRADPGDEGAWLNRARARAERDTRGAEEDFDRAIELAPDWGRAWAARGLFLEAQGRREEAGRDFLRAYELGESAPWLLDRVARLRR